MRALVALAALLVPFLGIAQNVGIGTNSPATRLHVADSAVVFSATGLPVDYFPKPPIEGAGRRMLWFPQKAAFRVGYVSGNEWNADSLGNFSFAAGRNAVAGTTGSIAMGLETRVEGYGGIAIGSNAKAGYNFGIAVGSYAIAGGAESIALGSNTTTTGTFSVAIANNASATWNSSMALGVSSQATAEFATALGYNSKASGSYSLALGYNARALAAYSYSMGPFAIANHASAFSIGNGTTASGLRSFAFGNNTIASGQYSTAMGNNVSTSGYEGSFALGDNSTTTVMESFVANGFRARFAGGYRLFTTSTVTVGAFLNAGANAWAALSDRRMKENFLPVDGEAFLQRIAAMPLTTWNYKGQDVKTMRHYGPMAQDFYAAFGKDALGEIGSDTLINQQDFLGVNLIAIQALEKRTAKINDIERKMEKLEKENAWLKAQLHSLLKAIKPGDVVLQPDPAN